MMGIKTRAASAVELISRVTPRSANTTADACVVSFVARHSAPASNATSAVPLQSITAPTGKPFRETMRPFSTTTFFSGAFQTVFKFGQAAKNCSATARNFSGRYGSTHRRPFLIGAPNSDSARWDGDVLSSRRIGVRRSINASANSRANPPLRKFPASS